MAAPPSLRHQQRLQLMAVNRALHQQQISIRMQNAFQRQRLQHLKSRQHYTRNIHLMGRPQTPRQPSSPNPFAGFVPPPFTPFKFTPFQFTPFQFTPFQFTPFQFTPFQFTPFPGQQKKPPPIIGKIGKAFAKLPLKSFKLVKLLKPFKPKGKMGRGLLRRRRRRGLFGRNRRGGRLNMLRLFGLRGRGRRGGRGGVRVPFTPFRIGGRGRRRNPVRRRRRGVRRPATMRQRLERQRWGKAGMRAARRHRRVRRRI